jgi:hypothetical protein
MFLFTYRIYLIVASFKHFCDKCKNYLRKPCTVTLRALASPGATHGM